MNEADKKLGVQTVRNMGMKKLECPPALGLSSPANPFSAHLFGFPVDPEKPKAAGKGTLAQPPNFAPAKRKGVKVVAPPRKFTKQDLREISWVRRPGGPEHHRYLLRCKRACELVESRNLALGESLIAQLYRDIPLRLGPLVAKRSPEDADAPVPIHITHTGVLRGMGKWLEKFLKCKVEGEKFTLPMSLWLKDLEGAVLTRKPWQWR